MATLRPFKAYRPLYTLAAEVASKPYDVLNSDEARVEVQSKPLSFLHVGKPEVDLDPSIHLYDPRVYAKAKENLKRLLRDGILVEDMVKSLYIYAQTMNGNTQYGIVGCVSVEEYNNDTIKKHELTRRDKEDDRTAHVRETNAHTGPIFLTYRANEHIDLIVNGVITQEPDNDFTTEDGVRHQVWCIQQIATIANIVEQFQNIPSLYVADGHHRSASAARVGLERAQANPHHTGEEEYNFFLAVLFPHNQLHIMDYNRVVKDLNGRTEEQFLRELENNFYVVESSPAVRPTKKATFGMYLNKRWFTLEAKAHIRTSSDPVESLDVSILQKHILQTILGIEDVRTDKRIDFIGGIRGLGALEQRVDSGEMQVAFSMYPTSLDELMAIADAGKIMPPKSTWFEPKLRDGLLVHFLD